jgi:hypothetical protein
MSRGTPPATAGPWSRRLVKEIAMEHRRRGRRAHRIDVPERLRCGSIDLRQIGSKHGLKPDHRGDRREKFRHRHHAARTTEMKAKAEKRTSPGAWSARNRKQLMYSRQHRSTNYAGPRRFSGRARRSFYLVQRVTYLMGLVVWSSPFASRQLIRFLSKPYQWRLRAVSSASLH